jgi:hypothetical protein
MEYEPTARPTGSTAFAPPPPTATTDGASRSTAFAAEAPAGPATRNSAVGAKAAEASGVSETERCGPKGAEAAMKGGGEESVPTSVALQRQDE